jgi:two-component system sensor histidine kinase UhpB
MWERLSLRTRLLLPLGLMFVAALLAGGVSLQIFATAQLMEEAEPAARSARAVAAALNGALRTSSDPQATLERSCNLGNPKPSVSPPRDRPRCPSTRGADSLRNGADWFVRLAPYRIRRLPRDDRGSRSATCVCARLSADITKWISFRSSAPELP